MSPATTESTWRQSSITTLTMKSQPAMRAIRVFSSWTGFPSRQPARALGCSRKAGPCQTLIVSKAASPGTYELPPAGKAGHEMRLDQADGDLEFGGDVTRVDPCRNAAGRRAQVGVGRQIVSVVVGDLIPLGNRRAEHLDLFRRSARPVQAGGDEDQDSLAGDAGGLQGRQQRFQNQPVGHRAGDVADGDACAAPSPRQFGQGRSAARLGQGPADRGRRIVNRRDRLIAETFY